MKGTLKRLITNQEEVFEEIDHDLSELFSEKVNFWIQKWTGNKFLESFIEPSVVAPGKMCGFHKVDNPVRVIISEFGTAVENLSIFAEKCLLDPRPTGVS